jgi:predicted ribosomally synthesized peptide with nif11-like leader
MQAATTMSTEQLKSLLEAASYDEILYKAIIKASKHEDLIAISEKAGFTITIDDIRNAPRQGLRITSSRK